MRRVWEIGATAALLLVLGLAGANGYSWYQRQQKLNAKLAGELASPVPSMPPIRHLLSQGADIHTLGPSGQSVLTAAAWAGDLPLAKLALDSGARHSVPDALYLAAFTDVRRSSSCSWPVERSRTSAASTTERRR